MRKIVLPLMLLLACSVSYAQIQKGYVIIGGSFLLVTSESGDFSFTDFDFSPRAGIFISDRTSLGPILGYQHSKREQTSLNFNSNDRTNIFTFGAYMRNYKSISEKFFFYLQSSVTYGTGQREFIDINGTAEADRSQFEISVIPGLSYFVTERLALDVRLASIRYRDESFDNVGAFPGTVDSQTFSITGGLNSVGFGLSWFLR